MCLWGKENRASNKESERHVRCSTQRGDKSHLRCTGTVFAFTHASTIRVEMLRTWTQDFRSNI